jgi:hypothetical protein
VSTTSGEPQSAWLAFKIVRHAAYLLRNLGAATEALARVQAGSGPMHLSSFESLNRELENNWTIAPFWRVFHDETLQVHEDDNDHAVVCLRTTSFNQVCGAPQFFSLATRFSAYEKVPSWITGIGLIFTFGMLMRGLSTLQVLDNDTRVSGIGTLINSLSAKFSSSVTAMICSLALSILITKREHEVERARAKLTSMVDSLFKLRSVAQLSSSGNEHLERMTESVRHLSTDLGDRLSNSMTQSLGPQFDRFSKAIDSLALHKNTGVDETLQKMIESFQRTLAQSTTGDFVNLRDAMSATAQQARAAAEETRTLVSRLGEQVVQQAELARRTTQDAAESMSTLTKHYRSQTKEDTEHSLQTFEALGELVRSLAGK